jgi:hypothetical protein
MFLKKNIPIFRGAYSLDGFMLYDEVGNYTVAVGRIFDFGPYNHVSGILLKKKNSTDGAAFDIVNENENDMVAFTSWDGFFMGSGAEDTAAGLNLKIIGPEGERFLVNGTNGNVWTKGNFTTAGEYICTGNYCYNVTILNQSGTGGNESFNQSFIEQYYVPYSGANSNVELGNKNITANILNITGGGNEIVVDTWLYLGALRYPEIWSRRTSDENILTTRDIFGIRATKSDVATLSFTDNLESTDHINTSNIQFNSSSNEINFNYADKYIFDGELTSTMFKGLFNFSIKNDVSKNYASFNGSDFAINETAFNQTYVNVDGDTMTGNLNLGNYNLTSAGVINLNGSSAIYSNGTCTFIKGTLSHMEVC